MKSIINLFEESVEKFSENNLLWEKGNGKYKPTTYKETHNKVITMAAGLLSIGIKKGDRVALLSEGRNSWVISELAILYTGAVNVPLSVKLETSELLFRLEHSDTKVVIVSGGQAAKIQMIKDKLPKLETIVYLDDQQNLDKNEKNILILEQAGERLLKETPEKLEDIKNSVKPNDYANISYTSGTTADPKGIILTHRNYTANVEQALTLMKIPENYKTLQILPLDHSFAHTVGIYSFIKCGASMAFVKNGKTALETLKNIPKNIKEIKPDLLLSVPALAKNFKKNIYSGLHAKNKFVYWLFLKAIKMSYRYNKEGYNKGCGLRFWEPVMLALYDKIIFKKIRKVFGGKLKFFIGGGALLDTELQQFFYAIGIPMFQGYGLSEATPVISSNSMAKHKLGSSGYLVQPMDLKIVKEDGTEAENMEKGEIVIKGENVMAGYWKNPEATAETIKDGWLHTGDMGYMDNDGFLYVLGRFKSLLIGNDGEKYSPESIEEAIVEHSKYIDQVMLHNNQNSYTIGLVVPNYPRLKRKMESLNKEINTPEGVRQATKILQYEINRFKKGGKHQEMFPERWIPATFAVLDEGFNEKNRLINSTMKMVRGKVEEYHKSKIDFLYSPDGKDPINDTNFNNLNEWKTN
jgi:long-chain acyl-CoA synthetase